jgi:formylglycine-generating enzyme required for sulfatase activity
VCYWIEKERSAKIEEYNEISLRMGGATEEQIKKLREFYKRQEEQQGQEQQQRQEQEQQQEQQQGQAIVFEDLEIEMIHVKGGPFRMGSIKYDDEKPIHEVILSGFFIGKYVVTQAQWTKIMGNNPSYNAQGGNYPVECVSWDDAQDFCARLNMLTGKSYRLPTEAEWEYAARGGNQSQGYEYSGSKKLDEVGWYGENSEGSTHPVGDKSKTANELGIHDMSGNVWEWCSDWYGEYPATPQKNPSGPSRGSFRVSRGGSWFNYAKSCRSANRNYYDPLNRFNVLGFRVAASASF